jgi:HTH-type transcriptional regulator / antitoxin HigA
MRYEWDPSKALRSVKIMSVDSSNPQSNGDNDLAPEYHFDFNKAKPNRFATQSSDRHYDLDAAQTVIDQLLDAPQLSPEQRDYLNILGMLVQEYEAQHVPIPDISGIELLKVLITDRGMKQKDLVPIFKTESIVSAVLSGQRNLTVEHIEKLAAFFHISPAVFFPV